MFVKAAQTQNKHTYRLSRCAGAYREHKQNNSIHAKKIQSHNKDSHWMRVGVITIKSESQNLPGQKKADFPQRAPCHVPIGPN